MSTVFDTPFEALPDDLPLFPLAGVLLLPRGQLPLNIFEPRYLAMLTHALGHGRLIGMIQPTNVDEDDDNPPLYRIGCAGRITRFAETEDNRLLITLKGVCRFALESEALVDEGWRRGQVRWADFADDMTGVPATEIDRPRLIAAARNFFGRRQVELDWEVVEATPDDPLVTSLAMVAPMEIQEKQALLEANGLGDRARVLTSLMEMDSFDMPAPGAHNH